MMKLDEQQYKHILLQLTLSNNGYRAIVDLSKMLEIQSQNKELAIREMNAEKKAIVKILDSDQNQKEKIKAVRSMWE